MATDVGAKKGEIPKQYNYNQHFRELIKEIWGLGIGDWGVCCWRSPLLTFI